MMKITKKMKTALDFVGQPKVRMINLENCLCRDLTNGYDIEVSGVNHPKEALRAKRTPLRISLRTREFN